MVKTFRGRALVAGSAEGTAIISSQPISFWGGVDPATGEIIDRRHELSGANISGKVFVFPHGKGSSTASAIFLEAARAGTAPSAIINTKVAPMIALGAILAEELYHKTIPVIVLPQEEFEAIEVGDCLTVDPDGTITVRRDPPDNRCQAATTTET